MSDVPVSIVSPVEKGSFFLNLFKELNEEDFSFFLNRIFNHHNFRYWYDTKILKFTQHPLNL